jgi:hypothetical protein
MIPSSSFSGGFLIGSHFDDDKSPYNSSDATSNVREYDQIKILEQLLDQDSIVVAETLLVARMTSPLSRYALRIVELRSEAALRAIVSSCLP